MHPSVLLRFVLFPPAAPPPRVPHGLFLRLAAAQDDRRFELNEHHLGAATSLVTLQTFTFVKLSKLLYICLIAAAAAIGALEYASTRCRHAELRSASRSSS